MPRGLIPVVVEGGAPAWNQTFYKAAGTAVLGVGDRVIRKADSTDPKGFSEVQKAAANGAHTGVITGIKPFAGGDITNQINCIPAGTAGYLQVDVNPASIFKIAEGGAGTALAKTNIDQSADVITNSDFDTVRNVSTAALDNATIGSGKALHIVGLLREINNDVGNTEVWWLVKANLHTDVNASAANMTDF